MMLPICQGVLLGASRPLSFLNLAVKKCDPYMMVDSLDDASNSQAAQHVENEHTTTTGTEAIYGNLQETIQSVQTRLRMLPGAVATNHDWLLQDAEHRADMIIMAWQQTAEDYCSALFAVNKSSIQRP